MGATTVALTKSRCVCLANLRFGVGVAGVNQRLTAFVAGVPIATGVPVFLAAAIPADAAHGVFVGGLVGAGL